MSELITKINVETQNGWSLTKLDDFAFLTFGQSPPSSTYNKNGRGIPFFQGRAEFGKLYPETKVWCTKPTRIAEKNDVLLCVRAGVGGTNLNPTRSCIGRGLASIRTLCDVNPMYVFYYLRSIENILSKQGRGSTLTGITSEELRQLFIPIAPLNEQKRIVAKIEELFSKLDSAKQILEKTKIHLKQYRQTLLKSAFEGKLTVDWRAKNKTNLDRILKKIEIGRKNQDRKLQKIEFDKNNTFFTIPPDWMWVKVGIISKELQYGTSEKATTTSSSIPVLRMGNIQEGELNFDNLKYYPENWKNFKQFSLESGDVLFNRTNSAELVGKTAVYRDHHPTATFAGYLIRIKIIDDAYIPLLLSWYINSIFGKSYIKSVVSQQVGQANVNATKLSMMPIPLMSFEEQTEIVSKLEHGFSLIKNIESITNLMLKLLDMIKSSILKQAFEGKLVPQDPNDEPAEVLLQKIKQEKEQLIQKQKSSKRNGK